MITDFVVVCFGGRINEIAIQGHETISTGYRSKVKLFSSDTLQGQVVTMYIGTM